MARSLGTNLAWWVPSPFCHGGKAMRSIAEVECFVVTEVENSSNVLFSTLRRNEAFSWICLYNQGRDRNDFACIHPGIATVRYNEAEMVSISRGDSMKPTTRSA